MQIIDPKTGRRAFVGLSPADRTVPQQLDGAESIYEEYYGTSVLLPLLPELEYAAKVMLFGGKRAWFVNLAAVTAAVREGRIQWDRTSLGSFANATPAPARTLLGRHGSPPVRKHVCSVVLPSGEIFFTGGIEPEPGNDKDLDKFAVLSAEIFGPSVAGDLTGTWEWSVIDEATNVPIVPRNYHSVALLMPDGRVWCAGSSIDHQERHESRMQVFEPWYVSRPRPVVVVCPDAIRYQATFRIQVSHDRPIRRVALLRCGTVTHAFNNDQCYVGVNFETNDDSILTATAPPSGDIAAPGMYLVFVIDERGVPSKGRFALLQL